MAEIKEYSADEVLELIKVERENKIKACQYPFHVTRYEIFKKYGADNTRPGLRQLVKTRRILMGETGNDYWFQIPEHDDKAAMERCKPKS